MWCDGRRRVDLEPGDRVEVRRGALPVLLARLHGVGADDGPQEGTEVGGAPFTDRLVAKFGLPVAGWRGGRLDGRPGAGPNDGSGGGEETAGGHA
jgi:NAD+ kinase